MKFETQSEHDTAQRMFSHGLLTLFAQGKAATADEQCAYRGEDGTRCFVGALIPDPVYSPALEGEDVQSRRVCGALTRSGWPHCEDAASPIIDFLMYAQAELHDRIKQEMDKHEPGALDFRPQLGKAAREFAKRWGLDLPTHTAFEHALGTPITYSLTDV